MDCRHNVIHISRTDLIYSGRIRAEGLTHSRANQQKTSQWDKFRNKFQYYFFLQIGFLIFFVHCLSSMFIVHSFFHMSLCISVFASYWHRGTSEPFKHQIGEIARYREMNKYSSIHHIFQKPSDFASNIWRLLQIISHPALETGVAWQPIMKPAIRYIYIHWCEVRVFPRVKASVHNARWALSNEKHTLQMPCYYMHGREKEKHKPPSYWLKYWLVTFLCEQQKEDFRSRRKVFICGLYAVEKGAGIHIIVICWRINIQFSLLSIEYPGLIWHF